jgi:hypothetical protein
MDHHPVPGYFLEALARAGISSGLFPGAFCLESLWQLQFWSMENFFSAGLNTVFQIKIELTQQV